MQDKLSSLIDDAETLADLLIEKANAIKVYCRLAKAQTAGASTPANISHLDRIAMEAVAKRRKRLKRH